MKRYPPTQDPSLRVFGAADDLLVSWGREHLPHEQPLLVAHDRFGAIALSLPQPVRFVATFHSQEEALRRNAGEAIPEVVPVVAPGVPTEGSLLRIPKSLDLFEVYLRLIATSATPTSRTAAGFMTRHFTPRLLEIAGRYAGKVEQSRATRKARLLLLSEFFDPGLPRPLPIHSLPYAGTTYRQFPGVFSATHIDYATQFLLEVWDRSALGKLSIPTAILDLACGNGIIGDQMLRKYPEAHLTCTDDSILAVESARLNLPPARSTVIYSHKLDDLDTQSQDLVVTNPPFHFGHENNVEISLELFRQVRRVLKTGGNLVIVANRHLNYATQLSLLYRVETIAANEKFVIYCCS